MNNQLYENILKNIGQGIKNALNKKDISTIDLNIKIKEAFKKLGFCITDGDKAHYNVYPETDYIRRCLERTIGIDGFKDAITKICYIEIEEKQMGVYDTYIPFWLEFKHHVINERWHLKTFEVNNLEELAEKLEDYITSISYRKIYDEEHKKRKLRLHELFLEDLE